MTRTTIHSISWKCLLILGLLGLFRTGYGQIVSPDTTASPGSAESLLSELDDSTAAPALLPPHMIVTQRIFWGPHGLLRAIKAAPLTTEGRMRELKIRRTMLVGHQVMGFVTLAGFVAQGIVGAKLYQAQGENFGRLLNTHSTIATCVNITYTTTALLSLTAPPKMVSERAGFSSIKLHKYLALVHIAGMITTNVLSGMIDAHPELKPYHRAAAYTTFGAFAASIIAIKF